MKNFNLIKIFVFLLFLGLAILLFGQTIKKPTNPYPYDMMDSTGQKWKYVAVCDESLRLPNKYCTTTVKKLFKYPDGLPTETCKKCKPSQLTYTVKYIKSKTGKTVYLVPFLLPALFIDKNYSDADYEKFINRIVEIDGTNTLRVFSAGVWDVAMINHVYYPYKKVDGKFDLDQMNPVWLDRTLNRIRYFVERGGTVIYTLIDGCSMQTHRKGHWSAHWWNGDNNINNTSIDRQSLLHLFSWQDRETIHTRYYVMKFMRFMVETLEREFPGSIVYDFNEFQCDAEAYIIFDEQIFKKHNISRERKIFSYVDWDRFSDIHLLVDRYIWQPHAICNWHDYLEEKHRRRSYRPVMYSADCCEMLTTPAVEQIVYDALISGSHGFENKHRITPPVTTLENRIDYSTIQGFKNALIRWLK